MTVTIERADPTLFDAAGKADFSFEVDAYLEPAFGLPVSEWRRIATEPYVKSYDKTDEDDGEWDDDSALFVAMLDGTPVGRLSVTRNWNGYGLLDHFGVDRPHRAGGIGNRLFDSAKNWAREQKLPGFRWKPRTTISPPAASMNDKASNSAASTGSSTVDFTPARAR